MGSKQLVSATFKKKLSSFVALREQINKGHFVLAAAYIEFAEQFTALYDEAKAQDKANGTKTHVESVLELGTLDGSQLTTQTISKWRKIAEEARELKKNQKYLPSSRDALYFIAKGVEKGVKISSLASRGELFPDSTLTDIKRLIPTGKRKVKKESKAKGGGATINIGSEINAFSAIPLGIDADQLPSAVQKLLNEGAVLLQVRIEFDPDKNRPSLMAVGYGV
jgi:hypothetical protein